MSVREQLLSLCGELQTSMAVLQKILAYYDEFTEENSSNMKTKENGIVISEIASNFYTCLETVFFRISRFFENSLDPARWHKEVLRKMTVTVPGIRERVITDETYRSLSELLRFRHFKRYYFDFDYDWDRLELIMKKIDKVRGPIVKELSDYIVYIESLANEAGVDEVD